MTINIANIAALNEGMSYKHTITITESMERWITLLPRGERK